MGLEILDALLRDSRLSDQARVLAIWFLRQEGGEDGFVPASYSDLRPLLHGIPSSDTVGRHVRMLEGCGWLDRRPGGRGNPDRFRLAPPVNTPLNIDPRSKGGAIVDSPPLKPTPKKDSPPVEPGSKGHLGGTVGGEEVEEAEEVVVPPPIPSPIESETEEEKPIIDHRAVSVLDARSADFNGCRGALRDYLEERVPPERQYGFVQTIASWIDGADRGVFRLPNGTQVPKAEVSGLLASALNELLATDESLMKRPTGDPGNLRTKVSILILQRDSHRREKKSPRPADKPKSNPISGDRSKRRRHSHG